MRGLFTLLKLVILLALGIALAGAAWLNLPIGFSDPKATVVDLSIEPSTAPKQVAQQAHDAGLQVDPTLLYTWFRVSGQARQIRAGSYEIDANTTPWELFNKLIRGEETLRALTLVEGWNWRQVRAALAKADALKPEAQSLTDAELMATLNRPGVSPEGRFYPDTYTYAKGSSDLHLLKRALHAMDKHLATAWAAKPSGLPLKNPEELLILASLVEKETGKGSDRPLIAGVFLNRLNKGMLLQTDPTVIYGLGDLYDGHLHKQDLQTDTPWNTYTRLGLPPTPIAMPGKAALMAAVNPANTNALYFVARGDGSSQFSATLEEHNRAVQRYIRHP